ncbi:MAG: hypothetical protein ACLQF1_07190 [Methyloceanibacter sp.]
MRAHADLISLPKAVLAAGLLAWASLPAHAGEAAFCVTCKGPDQTYLCRVTGEGIIRNDGLKLYCVIRTAKEGPHASCAARDEVSGCNGVERTYAYEGPDIPSDLAEDPRVQKLMKRVGGDQTNFRNDDKRKSLVDVTGEAMRASRRGLRNVRASLSGEATTSQSALPSSAPQSSAPPSGLSRSGQLPASPPLSKVPPPGARSAALSPDIVAVPPKPKSRVSRGAQNVGHFARNTYRCVRSLFRRCRSDTDVEHPN